MSTSWNLELKVALDALTGAGVIDACVNEMAFYGPEDAGHFTDPSLGFVQANVLELRTSNHQIFHFSCVQDVDTWAIWPRLAPADAQLSAGLGAGTFRTRQMPEFPRGAVTELQTDARGETGIQEIRMTIGQREVFLRAGEVYENMDSTLSVLDRDESVLVFLDGKSYARLTFNEPVYKPFHV